MRGILAIALLTAAAAGGCSTGGYEPADSLAGEMTPEWEEFAEQVDRTCATNFNASISALDELEERSQDWENARGEAAYRFIQAYHQQRTHDEIAELGTPPARPALFARWLANVGRRAELMRQAGRGWQRGIVQQSEIASLKIRAAKVDADWLGRHFGLRICTSNGPANNLDGEDDYIARVNDTCRDRIEHDWEAYRRGAFNIGAATGSTRGETIAMAAEAPPDDQYELRKRLLGARGALTRDLQRILARVNAGVMSLERANVVFERRMTDGRRRMAEEFGLPDCTWPGLNRMARVAREEHSE